MRQAYTLKEKMLERFLFTPAVQDAVIGRQWRRAKAKSQRPKAKDQKPKTFPELFLEQQTLTTQLETDLTR